MKLAPLVLRHTEQVLKDVLQFKGPADVLITTI